MAKVFSVFSSLGGSSMGYKRAGCEVIGGCEIDKKFANFYISKFSPQHMIIDDARVLLEKDYPFLYNLDIIDGSPPCTLFSRCNIHAEKYKGIPRKFKEGQKTQVLDDLIFVFADIVNKYKPRYFVMENVKGLITKTNKNYVKNFFEKLPNYTIEYGVLNSADLGLPQSRQRVFFLGKLSSALYANILNFKKEIHVPFGMIEDKSDTLEKDKTIKMFPIWEKVQPGEYFSSLFDNRIHFNYYKSHWDKVLPTITTNRTIYHYKYFRYLNEKEVCRAFGMPDDFMEGSSIHFQKLGYIVPPIFYEKITPRLLNW